MAIFKHSDNGNALADQAAQTADQAIKATQRATNEAMDGLADTVRHLHDDAAPVLNRAAARATEMAQHSLDAVRDGSQHLRASAQRASDNTVNYIKDEPVKAMLIAAATGAALMALVGMLRSRDRN
jgi:ElaB/YqjD/DUF883 family membrane-anchored ribosome-binding protein